jgi:uncharacterized protein (DUF1800 family)
MIAMPVSRSASHRYGYGPRTNASDADSSPASLLRQMDKFEPRPASIAAAPKRADVAALLASYLEEMRGRRKGAAVDETPMPDRDEAKAIRQMVNRSVRDHYAQLVDARFVTAIQSETPFMERLVHFWANHFAVSADKPTATGFAGLLEMEAVRPHLLGRFEDMLVAVEQHPAMLLYLDQVQSIGPNSPLGERISARGGKRGGINENLAREILELHTLGVRSGYAQSDVTEFARALTGWTVSGIAKGPVARAMKLGGNPGDFAFLAPIHEPGSRQIVGQRYDQQGLAQGLSILRDLARHPSTAKHIATKLARHFEGDSPSPALVTRLEQSFVKSGGDLPALYRILAESSEIRTAAQAKYKTPWDWMISAHRSLGLATNNAGRTVQILMQLGQPVWRPGSPAGFDDTTASWAGPDALFRRAEVAEKLAQFAPAGGSPMKLATASLGAGLSPATSQAIMRAESPAQATALMLVSPEFLRR